MPLNESPVTEAETSIQIDDGTKYTPESFEDQYDAQVFGNTSRPIADNINELKEQFDKVGTMLNLKDHEPTD
jgi:hypothetical protein